MGSRPGWKWGAGLQLLRLERGGTFLSEEAATGVGDAGPNARGFREALELCFSSHSGITGPQNSQFSRFVAFSCSLAGLASIRG